MSFKILKQIKFKLIRFIEVYPVLGLLIYNNISFFKFFLPHEKDFYGMLLVCENNRNNVIIDIGANLGISILGFRKLGFVNKILAFEPNYFLYKKYLTKIKKKNKDIFIKNIALGNSKGSNDFYMPFYKSKCLHYFCSFNKEYILKSINLAFPKIKKNVAIKRKKVNCNKYDNLNLKIKPHFIKIDTEGYDEFVLEGLKKTIKKFKPIFLIEYNEEYFDNIKKILKNYDYFYYDIKKNKLIRLSKIIPSNKISRLSKLNYLSSRNIFFIHKDKQ